MSSLESHQLLKRYILLFKYLKLLSASLLFQPVVVEPQAPAPVANVDMTQYQVQLVDLKSTLSYMLFKVVTTFS